MVSSNSFRRVSLTHPTGSPFSRNAARAIAEANLLNEIITTIAYNPQGVISHFLKRLPRSIARPILKELERRTWVAPQGAVMKTYPEREALRIGLVKTQLSNLLGLGKQGPIDWVYNSLDQQAARYHLDGIDAIYAYEDGAAITFATAKAEGVLCLYDLPIAFYKTAQAIQSEEANNFPEFAAALQATREPAWKLAGKDAEVNLADHIFVPSSFVRQSLLDADIPSEKISVIPFGAPIEYFNHYPKESKHFKALFVGRIGPRKGVHYLLQAWQSLRLPNAELMMVGINEFPDAWIAQYQDHFTYIPSVPHASLNQYYSNASVLVLPSLVEGLALVQLEAMSCGIPIITTPNAGGNDIITNGVEGFIIPIRDIDALQEKLEWCYENPQALAEMGKAARKKAEQLTWERYRSELGTKVEALVESYHSPCTS
ncbi:MAG: glycosyltransferase family 4 protein [Cyanobacteria bacterium J06560_6]